jgi:hypothetical protein
LSRLQELDKGFEGLFGKGDDGEEDNEISSRNPVSSFMRYYGWIYQASLVAEFERIPMEAVYDLPTLQFLNDLAYLKAKNEHERLEMKRWQSQSNR